MLSDRPALLYQKPLACLDGRGFEFRRHCVVKAVEETECPPPREATSARPSASRQAPSAVASSNAARPEPAKPSPAARPEPASQASSARRPLFVPSPTGMRAVINAAAEYLREKARPCGFR